MSYRNKKNWLRENDGFFLRVFLSSCPQILCTSLAVKLETFQRTEP